MKLAKTKLRATHLWCGEEDNLASNCSQYNLWLERRERTRWRECQHRQNLWYDSRVEPCTHQHVLCYERQPDSKSSMTSWTSRQRTRCTNRAGDILVINDWSMLIYIQLQNGFSNYNPAADIAHNIDGSVIIMILVTRRKCNAWNGNRKLSRIRYKYYFVNFWEHAKYSQKFYKEFRTLTRESKKDAKYQDKS